MVYITVDPVEMQDGQELTRYFGTAKQTSETYTYKFAQDNVSIKNMGNSDITVTVNSAPTTINQNRSALFTNVTTFSITASQGRQDFMAESWAAWTAGSGNGGGGGIVSLPVSGTRETVTQIDATFEGGQTAGAYFIPMIVYDCSAVPNFAAGGTFVTSFTPDTSISPTAINQVDDWYNFHTSDALSNGSLQTLSNTAGNITSGTRMTFTRSLTPPAGKTYFAIMPKFMPTSGAVSANYKVKMTNIVVTFNGQPLPISSIVNIGHSVYNAITTATQVNRTRDFSTYVPIKLQSRWAGKKYLAYGDSITSTVGGAVALTKVYPAIASTVLGIPSVTNRAVSGMTLTTISPNGLTTLMSQHHEFDLITIMLGVNDYSQSTPLGTIGAKTDATTSFNKGTYYGALRYCLDMIFQSNNAATVVLFTPIPKLSENANTVPLVLNDYRDAIVAVGKLYNVPVCRTEMCLNQNNSALYSPDGLHLSEEGQRRFGEYVASFLSSI